MFIIILLILQNSVAVSIILLKTVASINVVISVVKVLVYQIGKEIDVKQGCHK